MKIQELKKTEHLHHAYIVSGSAEHGPEAVAGMLEARGVSTKGNPDVLAFSFSELLVDNVRDALLPFASLKPLGERKYLIVSFARANDAAQNALLKAVEESLGRTIFFFCVDTAGHLLPTLRSRCIVVESGKEKGEKGTEEAEEFLKESYEKRLVRVDKMAGYVSKTQDRTPARMLVNELLTRMRAEKAAPKTLRDLLDASRYLRLQGSSVKSILGHLAVSLPKNGKS